MVLEGKLSEIIKVNPNTSYAKAKVKLHNYLKSQINKNNVFIWGRIFNIFGRNHHKQSLLV